MTDAVTAAGMSTWRTSVARNGVERSVLIASTFRSGSTYIGSLLQDASGWKHLTLELFNQLQNVRSLAAGGYDQQELGYHFDRILGTTQDGTFSSKVMWPHRNDLARLLGISRDSSVEFQEVFPSATWIFVSRRDLFSQAVSFWRAKASGRWHAWRHELPAADLIPPYDFEGIDSCYRELSTHFALWRDFFKKSKVAHIELVYEDVRDSPRDYLVEKLNGLDLPGLELANVPAVARLTKQSDIVSERYTDRYLSDLYVLGR